MGNLGGGCVMLLQLSDWNVNVSLSLKNKKRIFGRRASSHFDLLSSF